MAVHDDEPIVQQLAELLPSYDEALREGNALAAETPSGVAEPEHLRRALVCLRRLHAKWPVTGSSSSSVGTPSTDFCLPGSQLGRFEIIRPLGRGGHGIVFLARDPALRRLVALKVARPDTVLDPELHGRLRREAEAAAGLDHPNLVPVYELGQSGPWVYIVSTYCPGPSLAAWLKSNKEPVPIPAAVEVVAALADAVAYMHARGLLHRDIKPANVLLSTDSRVSSIEANGPTDSAPSSVLSAEYSALETYVPKLTDFGLAKVMDGGIRQTQTGAILGTPAYMSPEQAAGQEEFGPACDVYALGVLLYETLTGRLPYQAANPGELLRQVGCVEPLSPRRLRRAVPRALATICLHCLHKEPQQRYAGARELADDLRRFLRGEPIQARPPAAWARLGRWGRRHARYVAFVGVALVATLGTLALVRWRMPADQPPAWQAQLKKQQEIHNQHLQYASQISAAERAWEGRHLAHLGELLNGLRPGPGQPDRRGFEWHYLWHVYEEDGIRFAGHRHVTAVAYAPDGRLLATAGMEGNVRLWDPATGQLLHNLANHAGGVRTLVFAPDGRCLASGGNDGAIRLRDPATGRLLAVWQGHRAAVTCVAFAADGRTLASGSDDHDLFFWNVATGQLLARCTGHQHQVHSVLFLSDGNTVVSGASDGTLRVWESPTGKPLRVLSSSGMRLARSPDGRWLASGGDGGQVRLWDTRSWELATTIAATGPLVDSLAFSPSGSTLAEATRSQNSPACTLRLWDISALGKGGQGKPRLSTTLVTKGSLSALAFDPRGRSLAIADEPGSVRLWHPPFDPTPKVISHAPDEAWCVAFSPDGKALVSGGDNERLQAPLRLSDPMTGKTLWTSRGHQALVSCVAWSPDGQWIASGSYDNTVRLTRAVSGQVDVTLRGHTAPVRCLAFSPDGRLLASAGRDRSVILWDVPRRMRLQTFLGHTDEIRGLVFLPDGQHVVSAGLDKSVRTWQVGGEAVSRLESDSGIDGLAVSPDGALLAWGGEDGLTIVFDRTSGQKRPLASAHLEHVRAIAFSPDGRTLATAGKDCQIQMWHSATGIRLLTLRGHLQELHGLAFSAQGDALASASNDGAVKIWRAAARAEGR